MTATTEETVAERLEAEAGRVMARLIEVRGWDTARVRDDELGLLDVLLDEFNALGR